MYIYIIFGAFMLWRALIAKIGCASTTAVVLYNFRINPLSLRTVRGGNVKSVRSLSKIKSLDFMNKVTFF